MVHIPTEILMYNKLGAAGQTHASEVGVTGSILISTPGENCLEVLLLRFTVDGYNTSTTPDDPGNQPPNHTGGYNGSEGLQFYGWCLSTVSGGDQQVEPNVKRSVSR